MKKTTQQEARLCPFFCSPNNLEETKGYSSDYSYVMKQCSLLLFPVTVLVLMIIACSCCCYSCCGCDGRPDHRRRKIQVRPVAHSWSATRADTTYHQGHTWTLWFSPIRMTFCTSSLKMATTILINMTQRTRNHRMEFLLSATAIAELPGAIREVTLLHHHCLPSSGRWVGMRGHMLLRKQTHFPNGSPAAGPAKDSLCEQENLLS